MNKESGAALEHVKVARNALKERINAELDAREMARNAGLPSDGCGRGFVCPGQRGAPCNSGAGPHGTGLSYNKRNNSLHCFRCNSTYKPIDLLMLIHDGDYNAALADGAQRIGADMPGSDNSNSISMRTQPSASVTLSSMTQTTQWPEATDAYADYMQRTRAALTDVSAGAAYLTARGLDVDTARAMGIGFDAAHRERDSAGKYVSSPRIIVPTDIGGYLGRYVGASIPDGIDRVRNARGCKVTPSWTAHLEGTDPVYIVEGWADALAVTCGGGKAISLNSTSNVRILEAKIASLQAEGKDVPSLILALDPDEAGQAARDTLTHFCQQNGVRHADSNICADGRDPADAWMSDPDSFRTALQTDMARVRDLVPPQPELLPCGDLAAETAAPTAPGNAQPVILEAVGTATYAREHYAREVAQFAQYSDRRTGFSNIDAMGPFLPGLYCIGAITSLGKTTFCLQLANNLAAQGETVLYFSIEQDCRTMHSKSIARTLYGALGSSAPGSVSLSIGRVDACDSKEASDSYRDYLESVGDRLIIYECGSRLRPMDIDATVRDCAARMRADALAADGIAEGNAAADAPKYHHGPVVIVDYIQRLRPDNPRDLERTAMDNAVSTLQDLVLQTGSTVIAVSSLNRAAYLQPITFESAKGSGGIEFTADVFYGLELGCMRSPMFAKEQGDVTKRAVITRAKNEMPREIRLVCLKNRFGVSSYEALFYYYPDHDYFEALEELDPRVYRDAVTETIDFRPPAGRASWRDLAASYLGASSSNSAAPATPQLTGRTVTLTADYVHGLNANAAKRLYVGLTPPDARKELGRLKAGEAKQLLLRMFIDDEPIDFDEYTDTPDVPAL